MRYPKYSIGSRFILPNKYSEDSSFVKNKARLVAKGYNQKPGIDFHLLLARDQSSHAAKLGLKIHPLGVTSASYNI